MCHMGNEDRKLLMETVSSIPRDMEKKIEIHGGAGELGVCSLPIKAEGSSLKTTILQSISRSLVMIKRH